MKTRAKLLLVLLVSLLLTVIFVPTAAFAVDEIASGTCGADGDVVVWVLMDNFLLAIGGEGEMADYTEDSPAPWAKFSDDFDTVMIMEGVTHIGDRAFANCDELQTIEVHETVESIGSNVFSGCDMSGNMGIYFVGDAPKIASDAFNTVSLKAYYPKYYDTWTDSVLKNYGGTAVWEEYDPIKITEDAAYGKHGSNISWKMTEDGTLKFTGKGEMIGANAPGKKGQIRFSWETFEGDIKHIEIGEGITKIGHNAFYALEDVETVKLPSTLKAIEEEAFCRCELKSIYIPDGVEKIDTYVFRGCRNLTSVKLPASVDYLGLGVFWECTSLKEVTFKGNAPDWYDGDNAPTFGSMIIDRNQKVTIYYPANDATWTKEVRKDTFGNLTFTSVKTTPTNLKATVKEDSGKPYLTWTAASGAEKYEIYRSGLKDGPYEKIYTATNTRYTNTSAEIGRGYHYKVRAIDSDGIASEFTDSVYVTCTCPQPELNIELKASNGKPYLYWEKVDGARKYEVYRATTADGTYSKVYTTAGTTFNNTSASSGKTYYYKIKALEDTDGRGDSAFSEVKSITAACSTPVLSGAHSANSDTMYMPVVSWKAVTGAKEYKIYRTTPEDGIYHYLTTTDKTEYLDKDAKRGEIYYYKVNAVSAVTSDANSDFSQKLEVTCPPEPNNLKVSVDAATGKPKLTWDDEEGAVYGIVLRKEGADGEYKQVSLDEDGPWMLLSELKNSFIDTTAEIGKTYYYRLQMHGRLIETAEGGKTALSLGREGSATCACASPEASIALKASNKKPRVTWNKVAGASKYQVYRAESKNGTYKRVYTTTGTAFTNTSAVDGTTYYYKVKAIAAAGSSANSAFSNIVSITSGSTATPDPEPSADAPKATIEVTSKGYPRVEWDTVEGAVKYEVYRSESATGTFARTYTTTGKSYTNSSAKAGKTYYYKVRAVYADDKTGEFSAVVNATAVCAAPNVTITLKESTGKPRLSWSKVSGAAKYDIYRATSESGTYKKIYTASGTAFTNSSATDGKTYYYKVMAVCETGSAGNSAFSDIVSITCGSTVKPDPEPAANAPKATIEVTTKGYPRIKWNAVEGAAKYEVYRSESATGTFARAYTTTGKSYTNSSAKAGKTYYYKVRAVYSDSKTSEFSAVVNATAVCAAPDVTITLKESSGKPRLTWSKVSGAAKYEVYRATSETGTYKKVYTTTGTAFTNSSATAGKTYYYKVMAVCEASSAGNSAFSAVKSIASK